MSTWSTSHLDQQAYRLDQEISRLHEEIRQEQTKQQEARLRAERQQQYHKEYSTFAFLLRHDTREARAFLEQLYTRYEDFLRRDHRLEGDMRRLLSTETGAFESRLRSRLGLGS